MWDYCQDRKYQELYPCQSKKKEKQEWDTQTEQGICPFLPAMYNHVLLGGGAGAVGGAGDRSTEG